MPDRESIFASAFLCEKILTEINVHSAIRIVDTFTANIPEAVGPNEKVIAPLEVALFVNFKCEIAKEADARVVLKSPDGKAIQTFGPFRIALKGGPHGHYLKMPFFINAAALPEGLYWFDVFWGDELVQHAPMSLKHKRIAQESDSPIPKRETGHHPPRETET